MRKLVIFIQALLLCLSTSVNVFAISPSVSAKSAILTEASSGRILYSKNPNERLPMASTTKIMTALIALEEGRDRLDNVIEISPSAAGVEGSSMYLEAGEKLTLRELLYGLMLQSGNDAAVAIAEEIGGSIDGFVKMMNQKATDLNLTNTHFTNPNGLPDEAHYSSAYDMAKMTEYAMKNTDFKELVKTKSFSISGSGKAYPRTLKNHNRLLSMYEGCIGVKTGFTKVAGRCLVSSAERDKMTLVCVTLNAPDDWNDHMRLFDFGFDNYKMTLVADSKKSAGTVNINNSYTTSAHVYPEKDMLYPLKNGEEFVSSVLLMDLDAPVSANEVAGTMKISISPNTEIAEIPLTIKYKIEKIPILKQISTSLADRLSIIFTKLVIQFL